MLHTRDEVIQRTVREFEILDRLVTSLRYDDWLQTVVRTPGQDAWTVKDVLVHITYWKADIARLALGERRPADVRGLRTHDHNRLVYERWRDRTREDVVAYHRQVQAQVIAALNEAPEVWFNGKERTRPWPADLDSHSGAHRVRDMERVIARSR